VDINSTGSRKPVRKKAIGTRIAPGIPHVPGIGINSPYPDSGGIRHSLWTPCEGINSKEFSIGQGVIYTQTEPELGESVILGLKNARIRGVVNLGSAMVWINFELAKTYIITSSLW
jgi:hypothetical protein